MEQIYQKRYYSEKTTTAPAKDEVSITVTFNDNNCAN